MKRRQNGRIKDAAIGTVSIGTVGALGVAGWVAFRLYIRQQVQVELEKEGLSETIGAAAGIAGLIGINLNLPPSVVLAKSIVPMWSSIMPEEAFIDIGRHGRQSKYWPADYRTPSSLAVLGVEDAAFAALLNEVTTPRDGK